MPARFRQRRRGTRELGGRTGLAGVEDLAPDDPAGGRRHVGIVEDDTRALAAELERDRGEVLGGSLGDDLADAAATGVKDVVPFELEELGRLVDGPVDDLDRRRVHVLWHELGRELGDGGRLLGRLEHDRIAAGNGANGRPEKKHDRVAENHRQCVRSRREEKRADFQVPMTRTLPFGS